VNLKRRNVLFILTAALLHALSEWRYSGPLAVWLHSYGSNVTVSFAIYFLFQFVKLPGVHKPVVNGGYAFVLLLAEELAEKADMVAGVFDPWDLLWDFVGVAFAMGVDAATRPGDKAPLVS
jgi:hypothetical protein